ncbi:hypothetical protein [Achromobacter ruhlandii]|uniref:hypothetical protein n=1 Tax=Achromobacter ruhlandii TaxID=72557 RepID=UPI003B995554
MDGLVEKGRNLYLLFCRLKNCLKDTIQGRDFRPFGYQPIVFIGVLDTGRIINMAGIDTFNIICQARQVLIFDFKNRRGFYYLSCLSRRRENGQDARFYGHRDSAFPDARRATAARGAAAGAASPAGGRQ